MKIINNTTEKLADDLRVTIKKRSRVSMAAACFSVYAFEELKAQLENLDELRFIRCLAKIRVGVMKRSIAF